MIVLALLLAAAPRIALVVHPTGFSGDDAKKLAAKVASEVDSVGASAVLVDARPGCAGACLVSLVPGADAIVWIDAVRAGRQVELDVRAFDSDGARVAGDESVARA
ncbi:MAG TPA: hypothetical protein VGO62_03180, partial [Myxococcota bacterium]